MSRSNLYSSPSHYEEAKSALERQTAALLAERRQIENTQEIPKHFPKSGYP